MSSLVNLLKHIESQARKSKSKNRTEKMAICCSFSQKKGPGLKIRSPGNPNVLHGFSKS